MHTGIIFNPAMNKNDSRLIENFSRLTHIFEIITFQNMDRIERFIWANLWSPYCKSCRKRLYTWYFPDQPGYHPKTPISARNV